MTMLMLVKLLATKVVANKCSGDSRFLSMYEFFFVSLPAIFCFSEGANEKNATSEAEIKAEITNKNRIINKLIAIPVVNG